MPDLIPLDVQCILAKNDQEVTLEEAEEILNLLKTLTEIAVGQTLRTEQKVLNEVPISPEESSLKKRDPNIY